MSVRPSGRAADQLRELDRHLTEIGPEIENSRARASEAARHFDHLRLKQSAPANFPHNEVIGGAGREIVIPEPGFVIIELPDSLRADRVRHPNYVKAKVVDGGARSPS